MPGSPCILPQGFCRCFAVAGGSEGGRGQAAGEVEADAVFGGHTWQVRGSEYCSVKAQWLEGQVNDAVKTQAGWSSEQILARFAQSLLFLELMGIFHCHSLLAPLFTMLCVMTLDYFLGLLLTHVTVTHLCILVCGAFRQINNECIDLAVSLRESFCPCFILRGLMPMLIRHPASPIARALCS